MLAKIRTILGDRDYGRLKLLVLMFAAVALFEAISLGLILPFLGLLTDPTLIETSETIARLYQLTGVDSFEKFAMIIGCTLILAFILKNIVVFLIQRRSYRLTNHMHGRLSGRLLKAYMRLPYEVHMSRNTGDMTHRACGESRAFVDGYVSPLTVLVAEGMVTIALLVTLLLASPLATVIVVIAGGILGGGYVLLNRSVLGKYGDSRHAAIVKMFGLIIQALQSIKETHLLHLETYYLGRFRKQADIYARANATFHVYLQAPRLLVEVALVVGVIGFLLIQLASGADFMASVPKLALFVAVAFRIMPGFHKIVGALNQVSYNRVARDSIYDDLQELDQLERRESAGLTTEPTPMPFTVELEARDLQFAYAGSDVNVLDGVSFAMKKGEAVAFVGQSGGGKTTLINILLGLLQPTGGQVLVDGRSIADDLLGWQAHLGYIPQDVYVADDTLRRNVAFGVADDVISDERVWECLELAQLADFARGLDDGLETRMGDRGMRISGGQRQRVAIARALYRDPDVLVMDEATSALDTETERAFTEAVEQVAKDRTVFIVAHRLSTVRNADRIHVMEAGRITATGTYDELIETNDWFRTAAGVTAGHVT